MGILGSQTAGTDFTEQSVSLNRPRRLELATYTPAQAETITEVHFYYFNSSPAQTIPVGIYRADTDALVATVTFNLINNVDYAWSSETGLSIALTSGVEYKIALGCPSTNTVYFRTETVTGGVTESTTYPALPDPWAIHNTPFNQQFGLYAVTESAVPKPTLTVTQTELTPGGTISGSYSNYATVPTTLTVSDGANTITIASPTISDNGDGTGTFSGTMPSLPTSGSVAGIQFTTVATVELT